MSAIIVETTNLTRRYQDVLALNDLSLTIERGSIYGFIGPNGAGKTTTMRILTTLLAPTGGDARVAGYSVTRQPDSARRGLGYMPDTFGVYDDMKVWEYLDFFAACYGVSAGKRAALTRDLLDLVDLGGKRDSYVAALSRGMQQRLCLVRTLVHDPPLLILDEPASGLDPRARVELRELLKELRAMGKTILLSSHILTEMAEICTHVGIIERGELLASGRVDEIMRRLQGHRLVTVRALAAPAAALAAAADLPGVTRAVVVADDGAEAPHASERAIGQVRLRLTVDGDEQALAALLTGLIARGIVVFGFSEEQGDLEDLFMRLTTGAVQ